MKRFAQNVPRQPRDAASSTYKAQRLATTRRIAETERSLTRRRESPARRSLFFGVRTQQSFSGRISAEPVAVGEVSANRLEFQDWISVRYPRNYRTKHIPSQCVDTPNITLVPGLMQWTTTLPFTQIGRVLLMPRATAEHWDYRHPVDHADDFIWAQLGNKRFYVMQDSTRSYVTATLAWFHNGVCRHGSDEPEPGAVSLRVDGVFTAQFGQRVCHLICSQSPRQMGA